VNWKVRSLTSPEQALICVILLDALYGPPIGPETPGGITALIERLESLMPGIRIRERLIALGEKSHQSIVEFLGTHGLFLLINWNLSHGAIRLSYPTSYYFIQDGGDHESEPGQLTEARKRIEPWETRSLPQ
jgi:hypothetical protein